MDNGEKIGKDALGNCIGKLNAVTKQRDELLQATERLLAVIDRQAPSLEGMMELEDIRAVVAKARGEGRMELSGKMVEIPIEKFYKFDHSIHQGKYSVHVDSEAKYGFFEDDELGDEHGGSLWFATDAQGKLALTSYDGLVVLPTEVVRALESQGFVVADKFK